VTRYAGPGSDLDWTWHETKQKPLPRGAALDLVSKAKAFASDVGLSWGFHVKLVKVWRKAPKVNKPFPIWFTVSARKKHDRDPRLSYVDNLVRLTCEEIERRLQGTGDEK
jgi:hypothetical protein